jgi:hypothetical protein
VSAFLNSTTAHACFAVLLLAFAWKPRTVGITAFVVLTFTGCVEASQGRMHNAISAVGFGLIYGALPFAFWQPKPRNGRTTP